MARFIVDVANLKPEQIKKFAIAVGDIEIGDGIISAVCIDETNDNQFHDTPSKNYLSKEQINTFKKECDNN